MVEIANDKVAITADPVAVYLRVEGNEEFEIGRFYADASTYSKSGTVVIDYDRPLADLLRRVADAIERDDDLPVPDG